MPVRERNIKLLSESVTYIIVTETVTCILQQKRLCTAESTTCITATETPTCINTIKIVTHIFDAETTTCISAAETSNSVIGTETFTCMIATERSANITVTESTAHTVAIEPQNLYNCNRCCHCINIPLWTHLGHKGWRKDGKTFIRCYTIALKFWNEFNANFVLLYFLS